MWERLQNCSLHLIFIGFSWKRKFVALRISLEIRIKMLCFKCSNTILNLKVVWRYIQIIEPNKCVYWFLHNDSLFRQVCRENRYFSPLLTRWEIVRWIEEIRKNQERNRRLDMSLHCWQSVLRKRGNSMGKWERRKEARERKNGPNNSWSKSFAERVFFFVSLFPVLFLCFRQSPEMVTIQK